MRHAHARSNLDDRVSSVPPGEGLSELGVEEALRLRESLAHERVDLGVATRLRRTQETLELALAGRDVERVVAPALDEIGFGSFEAGLLGTYRAWAWTTGPDIVGPGGAESRAAAAGRFADALTALLERAEETILAVTHALPVRYVLDAADGRAPAARIAPVPHATPFALDAGAVERAAGTLRAWAAAPRFAETAEDPPFGSPHRAL